ncbi:hypothetical protein SAMN05421688_0766 [Poseidonocella pacifica]|uniref:Membrane-bound lysozyme-inhibitor of c-type lysozyme n=1 Tax=Poseidonocella pacifica TaxID=871651 RepID=A0A1I0VLF6_9RHOB|nr:hypothetical protein [Poseidonocella pacifica]SFA77309.1 hypothetical protein SAMN05421688_0766 [Poseidonocella pacifica]
MIRAVIFCLLAAPVAAESLVCEFHTECFVARCSDVSSYLDVSISDRGASLIDEVERNDAAYITDPETGDRTFITAPYYGMVKNLTRFSNGSAIYTTHGQDAGEPYASTLYGTCTETG